MLNLYKVVVLLTLLNIYVESIVPSLSVNKLNRRLVARKRQDTLNLCRMFNHENGRVDSLAHAKHNRVKRAAPAQASNDAERVESIIDKLYDDEQGEIIPWRRRSLSTTTTTKVVKYIGRRFDFAPSFIEEPDTPRNITPIVLSGDAKIPWHKHWEHGIIPYFIDPQTYDSFLIEKISDAFDYFERKTCIRLQRLKERPTDKKSLQNSDWVYITNPSGTRQCVHSNEYKPNVGVQMVVLGYDCMSRGEIVHEVMHILGFSHEHAREDRDHYVSILWDNIKPGYKKYFEAKGGFLELPYDYASVLHYPPRAFSRNGKFTIMAKPGTPIGQRDGLSETDVEKVSQIFGNECLHRNKQYLLATCPTVVAMAAPTPTNVSQQDIVDYFQDRLWPYGIVNYKLRDRIEFSVEERENIKAVIDHIEKETCIEFRDLTGNGDDGATTTPKSENEGSDKQDDSPKSGAESNDTNSNSASPAPQMPDPNTLNVKGDENSDKPNDNENKIDSDSPGSKEKMAEVQDVVVENKNMAEQDSRRNQVRAQSVKLKLFQKEKTHNRRNSNGDNNLPNKNVTVGGKRVRRSVPLSPARRHAGDILVLTRSPEPGCKCPNPGRSNGVQELVINQDCFNSVNDLLHVFVHVLGLDHQHNMHDRDSYLAINWTMASDELKEEMKHKLPPAASAGFPYDYQSVMHYPWLQIKNGVTNVMYPIWNDGWVMGHWQGLSSVDVQKLNLLYFDQCQSRKKHIARTLNA